MTTRPTQTTPPGCSAQATGRMVNELFERLKGIKPGWRAAFPTTAEENNAKAEWLLAIEAAGISDWSVIELALAELRQQPGAFLPSTGDFIALCRQVQLTEWRVPTEAEGFAMLQRFFGPRGVVRDFSQLNPAVYAAYKKLDWAYLSGRPQSEQRRSFREAWQLVERDLAEGRPLPEAKPPEELLEEQPPQRCRTEHAEQQLASIKDLVSDL